MLAPSQTTAIVAPANTWSYAYDTEPVRLRSDNLRYSDQRRYHPDKRARAADSLIRSATQLYIGGWRGALGTDRVPRVLPHTVQFRVPNLVAVCVRRKVRKEVLHAQRKTAKGAGSQRKRNIWSGIKC